MNNSLLVSRGVFALPQCSHITRKRGVYYFRKRLPMPHQGELALSLKTRHYRQAEAWGERLSAVWFHRLRSVEGWASMATADLAALIRSWLDEALEVEWERSLARPPGSSREHPDFKGVEISPLEAEIEGWKDTRVMAMEGLHHRDYALVASDARRLIKQHGLAPEKEAPLANGLMQALVKLTDIMTSRLEAMASGIPTWPLEAPTEPKEAPLMSTAVYPAQMPPAPPVATAETIASEANLSALLPDFIAEMRSNDGWTVHTLRQNQRTYDHLFAIIGDRPPSAYGKRDASMFKMALSGLPERYGNRKDWRGLPIQTIMERAKAEGVELIGQKTVKRHMSAAGRFFAWLIEHGHYSGLNPFYNFTYGSDRQRARDKRDKWSDDQLQRLFRSPIWQGSQKIKRAQPGPHIIRDHQWWLPILALYHGCRLEELASLRRSDIRTDQQTGIVYLDINDDPAHGKSLKTSGSVRVVPLHPYVQRLGFLEHVEKAAAPAGLVFPELRAGGDDGKYGHYYSRMFSAYRRQIGLGNEGVDFHSFRHNFITAAVRVVGMEVASAIAGHETNTSTTSRVYFKGYELTVLAEAIGKVEFPVVEEAISATRD